MPSRGRRLGWIAVSIAWIALAGPAAADAPEDRYATDSGQGLVTDLRTGLIWQQTPNASVYTWDQANAYCRSLSVGVMRGFRLPSLKELLTLVDPTRVQPAIDLTAFPNSATDWFWTASNRNSAGPAAVSFETGGSSFFAAGDALRVRCVR